VQIGTFADTGEALLRSNESGGYDSPAEIEAAFDISVVEEVISDHPRAVYEVAEIFPQLASGTELFWITLHSFVSRISNER